MSFSIGENDMVKLGIICRFESRCIGRINTIKMTKMKMKIKDKNEMNITIKSESNSMKTDRFH